jgi:hypothetical protein
VSFVPREERARRSRQAQFANGQRPGGSDVDPRQRRSSEAELQTSQRVGDGQEVDANGRAQVRKDKTIEVDSRNRHKVAADNLRFATPVDGSQAATKDYVDLQIAQSGTAYRVQTDLAFDQLYASPTGFITVPVVAGPGTTAVTSELDLGNLLAAGSDGILLKGGHSYIIRGGLSAISGNNNYHQGRLVAAVKNVTSGVLTILLWRTVRTSDDNRTHWTVEAVYTATEDVEAVLLYEWLITGSFRLAYPLLSAQRVAPYDEDNGPLPLPPLPDGFATISYNELTAVAWTDDLSLWGNGLPDSNTFTWTFDEWGPTYLDYSGASGSLVSHRFMDGGTHTVELTASGPSGSDTATVDVVVQDVVETQNLLPVDVDGFNYQFNVTSLTQSAIAAPDGTFTAWDVENTAGTTTILRHQMTLVAGHDYTMSFYVYLPSIDAAYPQFNTGFYSYASRLAQFRILPDGSIGYANFVSGAYTMTTERNVDIELLGNTGWARVSLLVPDWTNAGTSYTAQFSLVEAIRNGTVLTVWNPTLRYGDWVSRGKNWLPVGLPDYLASNYDTDISDLVTPDGTQSATTWTISAGTFGYAAYQTTYTGTVLIPVSSYIYYSFYFHTTDYSTSGAYPEIKSWHTIVVSTNSNTERESCQVYLQMQEGAVAVVSVTSQSSHTTYTASDVTLEQVDGRWWKCTLRVLDDSGLADRVYVGHAHGQGAVNVGKEMTIWNPRLTVGNPADMLDYFVSGPQNLLGDGSNYTGGYWAKDASVTITANAQVAPNGRLEADDITRAVNADDFRAYAVNLGTVITGGLVRYTFYVKPPSGLGSPTEQIEFNLADYPYTGFKEAVYVYLDYSTPATPAVSSVTSITTGGPGYTVNDVAITPISNGWSRIDIDLFDYGSNAEVVYVRHFGRDTANSGSAYTVSYWGSEITTITPKTPV